MHTRLLSAITLTVISFGLGAAVAQSTGEDGMEVLPNEPATVSPCVAKCFADNIVNFDCPDLQECVCFNDDLKTAVSNCILKSGCNIADTFSSQKSQADICGYPVRNKSSTITITASVLFSLAIAAATLRALARGNWSGGAGYGADDWVLFLCCLPSIGITVAVYMEVLSGLGQDIFRLSVHEVQHVLMWYYIGNTFYAPIVFGTKASFCLLYLRVWRDSGKFFRWACWTAIGVLGCAFISFEFSTIFICDPPSHIWQVLTRAATLNCIDRNPQLYTNSGVNIFMDLFVLLLPIPKILKLKMNKVKKIGLLATFMIGFAVTAVSVTQLYFLVMNVSKVSNPSWDYFPIGLWRVTEVYLSIICCCMPMMPGLFNRMFTRAANSIGVPSIIESLWEKTVTNSSLSSTTFKEWITSEPDRKSRWRAVKRGSKAGMVIAGPFDSQTGLELGERDAPLAGEGHSLETQRRSSAVSPEELGTDSNGRHIGEAV